MAQMRVRFAEPDPHYGPVPFWWWSGEEVTEERIRWQLRKFREGGLRNIGIIHLAPTGPQYGSCGDRPVFMSEEWWTLFEVALREAERLGMRLWFYDQIGFSGANKLARLVAENPEYAGYQLRRFAASEALPPGSQLLLESGGYRYAAVRQGFNWLDPLASAALLGRVHGELEKRFPGDLGRTIAGSFQDELPPLPLWSPDVPAVYGERYGENLLDALPALFDDIPGAADVRRRVYAIAAELAERAFFIPLGDWHRKYGMLIGCDQAGQGRRADIHGAQRLYLDYFRTHRWYNAPGADMDGDSKAHSSIVHLNGGSRVWLEAFHSSGWGGTIEETMHWLVPWLQSGVTLFSPHAVYYSTRGGWWEWAPPDTGWRQPYFEHYGIFADTVSRVCRLLSEGTHAADIAVHYPSFAALGYLSLDDVKPREHPMAASNRDPNERITQLRKAYLSMAGTTHRKVAESNTGALRDRGLDFDIVDDSSLAGGEVRDGALEIADERFQALVLCGTTVMDGPALAKARAMAEQGGLVVGVDVPEEERGALPGAVFAGSAEEAAALVERKLEKRVEGPGLSLHRRTDDADIFLLLPENGALLRMHEPADESARPLPAAVYRIRTAGVPELWDPVSGRIEPVAYVREGDWIRLEAGFDHWPSALIVCAEESAGNPGSRAADVPSAAVPNPGRERFPADPGAWTSGRGQVRTLDDWRVRIEATLDNRYGDFDLHNDRRSIMPPERRMMLVRTERPGEDGAAEGWHRPGISEAGWEERLWSESAYWHVHKGETFEPDKAQPLVYSNVFGDLKFRSWAGRMGRVPRRYLHLGEASKGDIVWASAFAVAPKEGRYWMRTESNAELTGWAGGKAIEWSGGPEEKTAWIWLKEGPNTVMLRAEARKDGMLRAGIEINESAGEPLPKWIYAERPSPESRLRMTLAAPEERQAHRVRVVFAARGRAVLQVNGVTVTEHGDFNPYIRQGQEEVDITAYWREGENEIGFLLPEGKGEVFADGTIELRGGGAIPFCTGPDWRDERGHAPLVLHAGVLQFAETESLWINDRPHPLPGVGWLMPGSVPATPPVPFVADLDAIGRAVWLRFPLPVGAHQLRLEAKGRVRLWIGGEEVPFAGGVSEFEPQNAGTIAAVRIEPDGALTEAAVLGAPVRFETVPRRGELGDWRTALHLPHHSGAVEYETKLALEEESAVALDLGYVRGTAEVWVNGSPAGVRVWRPYRYAIGTLPAGSHMLRIRVTNTLGTHYEHGRPTGLVGANPAVTYWDKTPRPEWQASFPTGGLYGPVRASIIQSGEDGH
ncbi:hypothetical protein IDH41_07915 [Paenibacillus sp. IB182493]|uniref:Glycosyl hydrolases family 2 sugar binding domain-containing protein n=1 Tax=Paenibacillus arenilitoris TaxID=2772299 RepID=A0A927CI32_9BACL|nr:hypothetical protein [Paenibacillus arenilitoris]